MKIAKVIASRSHIEYEAKVISSRKADANLLPSDYGLASFVSMNLANAKVIAVVCNSRVINPDYTISPQQPSQAIQRAVITSEYSNSRLIILNLLVVGYVKDSQNRHQPPSEIIPADTDVYLLSTQEMLDFHRDPKGKLKLGYYDLIAGLDNVLAKSLLLLIIEQLEEHVPINERASLTLLRRNLAWQSTLKSLSKV